MGCHLHLIYFFWCHACAITLSKPCWSGDLQLQLKKKAIGRQIHSQYYSAVTLVKKDFFLFNFPNSLIPLL